MIHFPYNLLSKTKQETWIAYGLALAVCLKSFPDDLFLPFPNLLSLSLRLNQNGWKNIRQRQQTSSNKTLDGIYRRVTAATVSNFLGTFDKTINYCDIYFLNDATNILIGDWKKNRTYCGQNAFMGFEFTITDVVTKFHTVSKLSHLSKQYNRSHSLSLNGIQ